MQDIECAICGNEQPKRLLYKATFSEKNISSKMFSARRDPDKIHYQLNQCTKCHLIISSPVFSNSKISRLYSGSYLSYTDQVIFATKTYITLFERILSRLANDPSILEIGCGNGFFLKALRKKCVRKLFGVEPSKKMVNEITSNSGIKVVCSIFKKGLFPNNSFDLVCCFHTLDHVINPNELVKETCNVMKKGGLALFVLHDTGAFSVKLLGEKSPIFDIEHIYLFNKKNIATLFKNNGFSVIEISDLKNTYALSYWIKMASLPGFLKKPVNKFLRFSKIDGLPFSLKGGNMYIVARKE